MKSEIAVIIDRSGSMYGLTSDTIGGYNAFLESQKKVEGEATFTLVTFNQSFTRVVDRQPLERVKPMTRLDYLAEGTTALLDAIGSTVDYIGNKLNQLPESERPDKVIVAILTDGFENASAEYSREKIKQMIEHQESKYGWEFIYLAANQDAFAVGSTMGIRAANTMNYTGDHDGVTASYVNLDNMTRSLRTSTSPN